MTHAEQVAGIAKIFEVFEAAVAAGGRQGAPGGVMYAAVLDKVTLEQFEKIMGALVRAGRIVKRGDLYFTRANA